MSGRFRIQVIGTLLVAIAAAPGSAGDYRGMTAGWPSYANGYYAANYPANSGLGPAYYVARPVAAAGYAVPPSGTLYAPVRAAYANPTYFAAYGRSPVGYRSVSTVGYAPAPGAYGAYYAPTTAYYAPVTANYAPANSYAVAPAGMSSAGSEAAAYFGQPAPLNYVPPRVAYRTAYAAVPVYMYRPVTTYQPVTGQPVTCLQASTCTTCQTQRTSCFSWWNPFTWFRHCSSGGCGAAPPTTAYCGTGCGQPYYPTAPVTPVVPVVPAPAVTVPPTNVIPATPFVPRGITIPPAGTTIPPPPTRTIIPGTTVPGAIVPGASGTLNPADLPPSLAPGTIRPGASGTFTPVPGTTITPLPGSTFPTQPGTTITPINPGFGAPIAPAPGSFPTTPGAPPPSSFGPGTFGTGTNYAPAFDPYSATLTPANPLNGPAGDMTPSSNLQPGPPHSVFGSGYRGSSPARSELPRSMPGDSGAIRAPELAPALPPSVQTVPDLDASPSPRPINSAPPLLDPRDKTAGVQNRWAVVPAQWPTKDKPSQQLSDHPVAPTKVHQPHDIAPLSASPYLRSPPSAAEYDDRGWKSAAGL